MFSGIVEARGSILSLKNNPSEESAQIVVSRPSHFDDIKLGDSIAVNGTCLTVENFTAEELYFTLGQETLKVTNWPEILRAYDSANPIKDNKPLNLERSLRFGDRIHGHLVSGHVDATGEVLSALRKGENFILKISYPPNISPFLWQKGSITVNGVSLTVNELDEEVFSVGLIPETLRQTQLGDLKTGDRVNLEADYLAKMFRKSYEKDRQNINKELNL